MRLTRFLIALACLLSCVSAVAQAQMPDPRQMSGIPRPVTDLPNGSISVRLIRGELTNNITDHPVDLYVDGKVQTVKTDAEGRAQFDRLPPGSTVKAVAVVDGERIESQEFPAPAEGAIRLMLVATDSSKPATASPATPAAPGTVAIAGESRIVIEPGEESVSVFYIIDIVNAASGPVTPTVPFEFDMPDGMTNVGVLQGSSPQATSNGRHITVSGPFAPGKTSIEVGGVLAVSGGSASFTQRFPANFDQPVFIAKKEGAMQVRSAQFDRQQDTVVEGTPVIIGAAGPIAAGQPLSITVAGLPYHSTTPRTVALGLAVVIAVVGLFFAFTPAATTEVSGEQKKLTGRREKLLQELAKLEQDHRRGRIDAPRFTSRREELMSALEHVYAALSHS